MASATVLSVDIVDVDKATILVSLDDVTLADKSSPQFSINFSMRNFEVWLQDKANNGKTVKDYVQTIIDSAVTNYKATQNVLSALKTGIMSW